MSVRSDGERVAATLFGERVQLVDQGDAAGSWLCAAAVVLFFLLEMLRIDFELLKKSGRGLE